MSATETAPPPGECRIRRITDAIWQMEQTLAPGIPLHVHLVKGQTAALIDTGLTDSFPHIQRLLATAGVPGPEVRLVLLTHPHHDHIGASNQVRRATGALFAAPRGAEPWIADHERQLREFALHHPHLVPDTPQLRQETIATMDGPLRVDLQIGEGFRADLGAGVTLEAIALPGHLPWELGYFEAGSGTLVLGDAVTGYDWPLFHGHVLPAAYRATLRRLRALTHDLPIRRALPAHFPALDGAAFLALLDRVEAYLDAVDAAVSGEVRRAGEADLATVWRGVCAAMNKEPEFRALGMVAAHLHDLQERGAIARTGPERYAWVAG
jgi:glyoxylase-like metal-dependent hydrolase (beta-lactamase superfamily II)